jgi:rhodanese-related sulfurtransferase
MSRCPSAEWRRILLEAMVIAALGAVIGLSFNHRLVLETVGKSAAARTAAASVSAYPVPVSLAELESLLAAGGLAVDARAAETYREGHLPGAVSLPLAEVDDRLELFRSRIAPGRTLVVYCSGAGCPDSFDLAVRLKGEGYRDVRVFEEGLPGWMAAGLPVVEGE